MEPTLLQGDLLLVNRAAIGPVISSLGWRLPGYSELELFDLVVLRMGRGSGPRLTIGKRIVGMPGDVLLMEEGILRINDRIVEEPFTTAMEEGIQQSSLPMQWQLDHLSSDVDSARYFPTLGNWGPIRIPTGHYFVLGDNRGHSIDSREMGLVTADDLVGRVDRVLLSHDGSCCDPVTLIRGVRWDRFNYDPVGLE